jgi:biopolymer transport protein ExbB/TolQ
VSPHTARVAVRHFRTLAFPKIWAQNHFMCEQLHKAVSPVQFAKRAAERVAAVVHGEMKRGLTGLATVATLAPWVGLFGTLLGILNSFNGLGGNMASFVGATAQGVSNACVLAALGLLVGLVSLLCYRYLASRLEVFDHEMEGSSLALVNQLCLCGRQPGAHPAR